MTAWYSNPLPDAPSTAITNPLPKAPSTAITLTTMPRCWCRRPLHCKSRGGAGEEDGGTGWQRVCQGCGSLHIWSGRTSRRDRRGSEAATTETETATMTMTLTATTTMMDTTTMTTDTTTTTTMMSTGTMTMGTMTTAKTTATVMTRR